MLNMLETRLAPFKEWKGTGAPVALFAFQSDNAQIDIQGLKADDALKTLATLAKADGFKGGDGDTLLIRTKHGSPAERVLLVGLGKREEFTPDTLRRAAARTLKAFEGLGLKETVLVAPKIAKNGELEGEIQALCEGLQLGAYRFERYKTPVGKRPCGDGKSADFIGRSRFCRARDCQARGETGTQHQRRHDVGARLGSMSRPAA